MFFNGKYAFLSNFYDHPIEYKGQHYKSSEYAYQAAKFDDPKIRVEITDCALPGQAKRMARKYSEYINPNWNEEKIGVMYEILSIKFSDPELEKMLSDVDEPIVEENTWNDTFWGVCDGKGKNMLGKLLERIKKEHEVF